MISRESSSTSHIQLIPAGADDLAIGLADPPVGAVATYTTPTGEKPSAQACSRAPVPCEGITCSGCGVSLWEDLQVADGLPYCEDCVERILACAHEEAVAFAKSQGKILRTPPRYDRRFRYACSRQDYESGATESYTSNSVRAYARHNCTNYEELIGGLDRFDPVDRVRYRAIRCRVEELLDDYVESVEYAVAGEPRVAIANACVRQGPSSSRAIVGLLPPGTPAMVTDIRKRWVRIWYFSGILLRSGWALKRHMRSADAADGAAFLESGWSSHA